MDWNAAIEENRKVLKRVLPCSSPSRPAFQPPSIPQHAIRNAVAVARLVGVPAAVHVRQIEGPDGAQGAGVREELADQGGAAYVDAEHVRAAREKMNYVLRHRDALLEKGLVHPARRGRAIRGEIGK